MLLHDSSAVFSGTKEIIICMTQKAFKSTVSEERETLISLSESRVPSVVDTTQIIWFKKRLCLSGQSSRGPCLLWTAV